MATWPLAGGRRRKSQVTARLELGIRRLSVRLSGVLLVARRLLGFRLFAGRLGSRLLGGPGG